jgi:hypothetical protein
MVMNALIAAGTGAITAATHKTRLSQKKTYKSARIARV